MGTLLKHWRTRKINTCLFSVPIQDLCWIPCHFALLNYQSVSFSTWKTSIQQQRWFAYWRKNRKSMKVKIYRLFDYDLITPFFQPWWKSIWIFSKKTLNTYSKFMLDPCLTDFFVQCCRTFKSNTVLSHNRIFRLSIVSKQHALLHRYPWLHLHIPRKDDSRHLICPFACYRYDTRTNDNLFQATRDRANL